MFFSIIFWRFFNFFWDLQFYCSWPWISWPPTLLLEVPPPQKPVKILSQIIQNRKKMQNLQFSTIMSLTKVAWNICLKLFCKRFIDLNCRQFDNEMHIVNKQNGQWLRHMCRKQPIDGNLPAISVLENSASGLHRVYTLQNYVFSEKSN